MEEKDYIYVYNKKGKKEKMELVLSFEIDETQYIVYKQLDKTVPLYMAKIEIKKGITSIDTNLSEKEQEIVTGVIRDYFLGENYEKI